MSTQLIRTKLPGFERKLGAMVHDMANHFANEEGIKTKKVHGYIEVKPANPFDSVARQTGVDWVAFLHVRVIDGTVYSMPVIPDEHNPRPDKIVRPDDAPHIFTTMREAETLATNELPGFVAHIERQL